MFGNESIEINQMEREVITSIFSEVYSALRNDEKLYIGEIVAETERNLNQYVDDFTDEASGRTTEEILSEVFDRFGVGFDRLLMAQNRTEQETT